MTDKATPRPWSAGEDVHDVPVICAGYEIIARFTHTPTQRERALADRDLTLEAVNAYDPDREAKVKALVEAATKLSKQDTMHRNEPCALVNASDLNGLREALAALGETA